MTLEDHIQPEIVEKARQHVGDSLRIVGGYHQQQYKILYTRSDLTERFSEKEWDEIFDDFLMEGLGTPVTEHLYGESPRCQIEILQDYAVFHFHKDELSGHVLSVDISGLSELHDFVDACNIYTAPEEE